MVQPWIGVTGVAASSGNAANAYKGIAPNADPILVALDFESDYETVAIDAIDYVFSKAAELGKPCHQYQLLVYTQDLTMAGPGPPRP